jgi:hypothetical protein
MYTCFENVHMIRNRFLITGNYLDFRSPDFIEYRFRFFLNYNEKARSITDLTLNILLLFASMYSN